MTAMKAYGHIKNLDQIKNTFKECKSHYRLGRNMYPQYIQSVLQTGDLSTAYKAYREFMDHLKMKEVSSCLAEIVSECVIRNNLELALRATSEFQEKQLEWDTYALTRTKKALWAGYSHLIPVDSTINTESIERFTTLYIDKLNDKNQPTRLKKLFTPAHLYVLFQLFSINVLPSIKTFNYLLECQSLDNQYGKVKSILSMMQSSNIQPDSFTVSILLRTFGSSLSGEDKMTLYHILSAADKKMDIDVHKTFLKIFTDIAHVKKSTEVLFTAKEQGVGLSEDSYMTILSGYIKKGAIEKGFKVLNDSHVNNMDCYAMLFEAFLERGQLLDCIIHYRELKKAKPAYMHAIETNRRIFKAVLTANIARRDWPRCRSLLHSRHIEFTPKTIMRIMNVLLGLKYKDQYIMDGKDMVKALECMENSLKVYLNSQGISRLIMVMGDRGECEACYSLYNYVRSDPASNKRCASSKLYLAMMDAAVKNSDGRKLERAWVDMQYRSQYTRPDRELKKEIHSLSAYNILLNGYASLLPRPDLTKTKRVFKKILNQNLIPDTGTYNILIKAFVNSDNIEAAYKILYKMIKSGIKPDSYTTNTILTGIINSQDWGSVEKFIQQMKRLKLASHFDIITYNLLLQGFLHLDSRTLDYVHLLKLRHKWERAERIEKRNASRALSSADVWNIFESATGYKRSDVLDTAEDPPSIYLRKDMDYPDLCKQLVSLDLPTSSHEEQPKTPNAFVQLFSNSSNIKPDAATYKLFIKAFTIAGDKHSASKVYQWMHHHSLK
ncbi:hypothetical protein BDB01DRAFT_720673 [Pilobolus umbonatus]|nr:hypothetical protein BDB01DRAFT_720673 [Pilobolus umbonatus]